jgi:hypothetical protein
MLRASLAQSEWEGVSISRMWLFLTIAGKRGIYRFAIVNLGRQSAGTAKPLTGQEIA